MTDDVLLDVEDLKVHFPLRGSFGQRLVGREAGSVKAVDGVTFQLRRGEVLGLVGESGSGKTTLGRTLIRLVPPTSGSIRFEGQEISGHSESDFRDLRRRMQIVFQDPHASLNPAMDLGTAVGHPLEIHGMVRQRRGARLQVAEALRRVGLSPPEEFMSKYPSDLSGGQKQRAVLARAVILGPDLLIADEPVSMLDMSVRAKILQLMLDLKQDLGLTYLYITHDLATAKFFCDRIAIMYLGRIVEIGPSDAIYADPKHPYTVSLLKAIPEPDPTRAVPRDLPRGEVPDAVNPPLGCNFHPRCPQAFAVCGWEARDVGDLIEERWTGLAEGAFEEEEALIGDLGELAQPGLQRVRLSAGSGRTGAEVAELLERIRADKPDARLWEGVRHIEPEADAVVIELRAALEPRPLERANVTVECHLYDEEARKLAETERSPRATCVSPSEPARCSAELLAVRADPSDGSEQVTQLVRDEPVSVEERRGDWTRIRTAYDYPGWVRADGLLGGRERGRLLARARSGRRPGGRGAGVPRVAVRMGRDDRARNRLLRPRAHGVPAGRSSDPAGRRPAGGRGRAGARS